MERTEGLREEYEKTSDCIYDACCEANRWQRQLQQEAGKIHGYSRQIQETLDTMRFEMQTCLDALNQAWPSGLKYGNGRDQH